MNRDIRKITDGAMMVALIGVVLVVNRQMAGLLESMFIWAYPLPMVFYGAKYGWKNAVTVFVSMLLLAMILGTPQTIFYLFSAELTGMIYGCCLHHHVSTQKIVLVTILISVVTNLLTMIIFAEFFGFDLSRDVMELQGVINQAVPLIQSKVLKEALIQMNVAHILRTIFIMSIILYGAMSGVVTHLLSYMMLKRLRFPVAKMQPLALYLPPKWTAYVGVFGFVLYSYGINGSFSSTLLQDACIGLGVILIMYLAWFGYIALAIIFRRFFASRGIAIVMAIMVTVIGSMFVAVLGYLYITTDLHDRLLKGA